MADKRITLVVDEKWLETLRNVTSDVYPEETCTWENVQDAIEDVELPLPPLILPTEDFFVTVRWTEEATYEAEVKIDAAHYRAWMKEHAQPDAVHSGGWVKDFLDSHEYRWVDQVDTNTAFESVDERDITEVTLPGDES